MVVTGIYKKYIQSRCNAVHYNAVTEKNVSGEHIVCHVWMNQGIIINTIVSLCHTMRLYSIGYNTLEMIVCSGTYTNISQTNGVEGVSRYTYMLER